MWLQLSLVSIHTNAWALVDFTWLAAFKYFHDNSAVLPDKFPFSMYNWLGMRLWVLYHDTTLKSSKNVPNRRPVPLTPLSSTV